MEFRLLENTFSSKIFTIITRQNTPSTLPPQAQGNQKLSQGPVYWTLVSLKQKGVGSGGKYE